LQIIFLQTRKDGDLNTATLISCGAGGFIHLWNHVAGKLIGYYNIWDNSRHTIPERDRHLDCVTAMKTDSSASLLITGNSIGYIQASTGGYLEYYLPEGYIF